MLTLGGNSGGEIMQSKSKMLKKAFTTAFPYTIPIFAGLVSRPYIWYLHECVGLQLLVSNAYEYYDFRGFNRVCDSQYAAGSLQSPAGIRYDSDDKRPASVLRDFHAG